MKSASLFSDLEYNPDRPAISVLMETEHSKEIRILLVSGQEMKEHKTPYPIVIEVFEGNILFGVKGDVHELKKGDVVSLEGGIHHDLKAQSDSIIRLTISKMDSLKRVQKVTRK